MKVLIVEDERLSAARLEKLLANFPRIVVSGVAHDGMEAVHMIDELKPDAVFLDVELPEFNGFEVLKRATHRSRVIFTTAYDQYAVKAFEREGLDYLLKPVELHRLQVTIERLEKAAGEKRDKPRDMFPVKNGQDVLLVRSDDIFFFKSEDRYVFLYTADRRYPFDMNLKQLQDHLDPGKFVRIHRNTIIALDKVLSVKKWFLGELNIQMKDNDGSLLRVGKTYVKKVRSLLGI